MIETYRGKIQANLSEIKTALESYDAQLDMVDKISNYFSPEKEADVIQKLRAFYDKTIHEHQQYIPVSNELSAQELFELANILFVSENIEAKNIEKEKVAYQIIDNLKKRFRLDKIEEIYKYFSEFLRFHDISKKDIFDLYCTYSEYTEKNTYLFEQSPRVFLLLLMSNQNKVLNENVYIQICHEAQYAKFIVSIFSELKRCGISDANKYLAVCENIKFIKKLYDTYGKDIYYAALKNIDYIHNIQLEFFRLSQRHAQLDKEVLLALCKNIALFVKVTKNVDLMVYYAVLNNLDHIQYIDSMFSILENSSIRNTEIYLNICARSSTYSSTEYAEYIKKIFSYLAEHNSNIEDYLNVILNIESIVSVFQILYKIEATSLIFLEGAFLKNLKFARNIDSSFSLLKKASINIENIKHAYVCILNYPQHAEFLTSIFLELNNAHILNEKICIDIPQNLKHIHSAIETLMKSNIDNTKIFMLVFKHSTHAEKIAKALICFQKIGYLNNDLIELICEHVDHAEDIAKIIVCLKSTGLFIGKNDSFKTLFECAQYAKDMLPLFELMIKTDLFISYYYHPDIILMKKLPENKTIKNIVIMTQDPIAVYHFDENGKQTEVFGGSKLKEFEIGYLFAKDLSNNESENITENITDLIESKKYYALSKKIHDGIISAGCNPDCEHRSDNFKLVCEYAKYAKKLLSLFERLNSVGLVFQSNFVAACKNAENAESINEVFRHLNTLNMFNKQNCQIVFENGKYVQDIATAFECLYEASLNFDMSLLYNSDIGCLFDLILQCSKYAQNLASILICLEKSGALAELTHQSVERIKNNAKFSTAILAAFNALLLGNKLTTDTFNLIYDNPAKAISIALENGGIAEKGNQAIEEHKHLQETAKVLRESGAGLFSGKPAPENALKAEDYTSFCRLPKNVIYEILNSGEHTLDEETCHEVIRKNL